MVGIGNNTSKIGKLDIDYLENGDRGINEGVSDMSGCKTGGKRR